MSSTQLQTIKQTLMAPGALAIFRDNLPNATGDHAEKAAARFAKMVYTQVSLSPSLQKCSVESVIKAASISASLDLDIDPRGLAYLVPYGNVANFQIGYMGLMELAYRSGKVKAISAHCVYASEKDSVTITRLNGQFDVEHPFSYEPPTGEMIAVYATAEIEGFGPRTVVLRADEVERFRNVGKSANSPAWTDHYEAMAKKTAIRQLAKFLPKSILEDFSRGAALDERESFVDASKSADNTIATQMGAEVIDIVAETPEPVQEEQVQADPEDWLKG